MNKYYSYKGINIWQDEKWQWRSSQLLPLVTWMQDKECSRGADMFDPDAAQKQMQRWQEQGLVLEDHFIGGRWLTMVPRSAYQNRQKKLTTLVVFHREEEQDPNWIAKTLLCHKQYNDMAVADNMILLYIVMQKGSRLPEYWSILMEAGAMYPIDYNRLYLDLSEVYGSGDALSQVPGLILYDEKWQPLEDPDLLVNRFGSLDIPVLDISQRWQNRYGSNRPQVTKQDGVQGFDLSEYIHSETGRKQAEALWLEYNHDTIDDVGFHLYWMERGLSYESHDVNGDRWLAVFPVHMAEQPERKLPVLIMLQEVYYCNEHYPVEAFSYYYEYCKLVAQGEFIGIFWSAERPEDHEPLVEILRRAAELYPVDPTRVYITGHSHNGHYGYEFARRHTELITAVATMGNSCGLSATNHFALTDEQLDDLASKELPLVNLCGFNEGSYRFLWNRKGIFVPEEWQRRLRASNCPAKTVEEIAAAAESGDYVTRRLGIPGDRTEVLYLDNREHCIMDIRNNAGKYHLRLVVADNAPHNPTPSLQTLGWSFLRRFSRDPKTLKIHEDY